MQSAGVNPPLAQASAERWYGTVYGIAFSVARRRFRFGSADAEDVAQEMTLRALRQRGRAEVNRAWVYRGATFLCIDLARTRESERCALDAYVLHARGAAGARRLELERDLHLAAGMLPVHCRRLLHAYFGEGRSWREIDSLLARGRRTSQYDTGKCVEQLRRLFVVRREWS
jgi:DNA-directed RNA polymerase specialized sigma24 family protein